MWKCMALVAELIGLPKKWKIDLERNASTPWTFTICANREI